MRRNFPAALPDMAVWHYHDLFRADEVPTATYIFTDIERLYPWEARLAGASFRSLRAAGLRCLNDPARVLGRYPLLKLLHREGINPFDAYPADERPAPRRFPVFVRVEQNHRSPMRKMLASQRELEEYLARRVENGVPLRGLIVVEFCGEPIAPGIWRKFGTFRIGTRLHVDRHVTQDNWMVKQGTPGLCPEWLYVEENRTVLENRHPRAVARAFELAGIEYGRADHGLVQGRDIVYEINTNPYVAETEPQRSPTRDRTIAHSRSVMAESFFAIDSGDGAPVAVAPHPKVLEFRKKARTDKMPAWRP